MRLAGITGVYEPPDKPSLKSMFKRKISSGDTKKTSPDGRNSLTGGGELNELSLINLIFSLRGGANFF